MQISKDYFVFYLSPSDFVSPTFFVKIWMKTWPLTVLRRRVCFVCRGVTASNLLTGSRIF